MVVFSLQAWCGMPAFPFCEVDRPGPRGSLAAGLVLLVVESGWRVGKFVCENGKRNVYEKGA